MLFRLRKRHESAHSKRNHADSNRSADTTVNVLPVANLSDSRGWQVEDIRLVVDHPNPVLIKIQICMRTRLQVGYGATVVAELVSSIGSKCTEGRGHAQRDGDESAPKDPLRSSR